jgi:hypothetical protein
MATLPITKRLVVLDTSYLLEFFQVPGESQAQAYAPVEARIKEALENKDQMFLPLPVLFELGNHITDIKNFELRKTLAKKLFDLVKSSIENEVPFTITPLVGEIESIQELLTALQKVGEEFQQLQANAKRLGLTDTVVVMEAQRLKSKFEPQSSKLKKYLVHIWTRHQEIKAREPDQEANPFV